MASKGGSYDVIVVGAGSVGAPAAYFLSEAGLKTLVVDASASAGQGANKTACQMTVCSSRRNQKNPLQAWQVLKA